MKREIIHIDEDLCDGCGDCVPNCHEGALQIIDGKARLISDLMCDGLGACIGHCPLGAITMEEREAEPYNEVKVMEQMITKGKNTIIAHLSHLKEHGEREFLQQGVRYMLEHRDQLNFEPEEVMAAVHGSGHGSGHGHGHPIMEAAMESDPGCGCQGSQSQTFGKPQKVPALGAVDQESALTHWPVQMHLINPRASHFQGSHLLLAADCVAFSLGNFHNKFLQGKTLAIACPKLDSNREVYLDKIRTLVDESQIDMLTIMIMEVPCCSGLLQLAESALSQCTRQVPVKVVVVSVDGQIKMERWHKVA